MLLAVLVYRLTLGYINRDKSIILTKFEEIKGEKQHTACHIFLLWLVWVYRLTLQITCKFDANVNKFINRDKLSILTMFEEIKVERQHTACCIFHSWLVWVYRLTLVYSLMWVYRLTWPITCKLDTNLSKIDK